MAGTVLGVLSVAGGVVGTEREGDGGVERRLMSSVIHSRSQSISKISVTHYFQAINHVMCVLIVLESQPRTSIHGKLRAISCVRYQTAVALG